MYKANKLKQYQYQIAKMRCSFCNKAQEQVAHLFSGPNGVCICNECVSICSDILNGDANIGAYADYDTKLKAKKITLAEELEYMDQGLDIIDESVKTSDIRAILKAADYNLDRVKQTYALYNNQNTSIENFVGWMISTIKSSLIT